MGGALYARIVTPSMIIFFARGFFDGERRAPPSPAAAPDRFAGAALSGGVARAVAVFAAGGTAGFSGVFGAGS